MAVEVIKATRVVRTMLGVLVRDVVLPNLVWRDAGGDFRGAEGDTITIRVPSYFNAKKRALRGSQTKAASSLVETKVDVTLTDNLFGRVPITSEELTLDIDSFNREITLPVSGGIVRGLEDELVAEMQGATYQHEVEFDTTNPYSSAVEARRKLNDSFVPFDGRALAIGTGLEEYFLNSPQFARADQSGSTDALRNANIGNVAGFQVFVIPGLDPEEGYAFHRTAYVLNQRAPFVSAGTPWGATESFEGFAVRVAQAVDPETLVDNFHADVYVGTNHVRDFGAVGSDGKFVPDDDPDIDQDTPVFVRSVKLSIGS